MNRLARVGDMVFFPRCKHAKYYPIENGHPKFMEAGMPIACVGNTIRNKYHPWIASGSSKYYDGMMAAACVGDEVICPKCGLGHIIDGSPKFMENG
jgi:uncharacterized Zn-binding protein involved in type VI secretion